MSTFSSTSGPCPVCGHAKIYCEGAKVLVPPLNSERLNPYCFAVRVQSNDEDHTVRFTVPCHARLWFDQLVGSEAYIEAHNGYGCNIQISRDLTVRRTILGYGWHELLSNNMATKGDECVVAFGPSSCFEAYFHYGLHVLPYYRYMAPLVPHIVCDPGFPDSFVFPKEFANQINRDYDDALLHLGYKPCGVDAWLSFGSPDGAKTGTIWRDVISDLQPRVGMLCLFVFSGPYFHRLHYAVNFF
ncbi:hypothetical protein ACP70R_017620 [Stipagrostis hirtigluma subsp. patula]